MLDDPVTWHVYQNIWNVEDKKGNIEAGSRGYTQVGSQAINLGIAYIGTTSKARQYSFGPGVRASAKPL